MNDRLAPDDPRHGTVNAYHNLRCRCDHCRAAAAAYFRRWRDARRGQPPPSHGASGYRNYGCRCDTCREAQRRFKRARELRVRIDRLRAKAAALGFDLVPR